MSDDLLGWLYEWQPSRADGDANWGFEFRELKRELQRELHSGQSANESAYMYRNDDRIPNSDRNIYGWKRDSAGAWDYEVPHRELHAGTAGSDVHRHGIEWSGRRANKRNGDGDRYDSGWVDIGVDGGNGLDVCGE